MSKEELLLLNAFLGVIDHLWSCISPSANDKIWHQLHRVSNGIWWSPSPHKQNTSTTKKTIHPIKCLNLSTPRWWELLATQIREPQFPVNSFCIGESHACDLCDPQCFNGDDYERLYFINIKHNGNDTILWVKSNIPLYLPFSIWLAVGNDMLVNVIIEYFILTFLEETKGP